MGARATVETFLGPVTLETEHGALVGVRFGAEPPGEAAPDGVLEQAVRELREYLDGRRQRFTVPVGLPAGATPFQRRVWEAMGRIPFGDTRTYGDLARQLGTAARAVGGACGRNPVPIVVPCHRVVARDGLGGYAGQWETGRALTVKQALLEHEARALGART